MALKRIQLVFLITFLVALFPSTLSEQGIAGNWSGSIKAGGFSFGASVTFSEGGSYSIRAGGLSSSGSYSASNSSITLRPSSPRGFSATTMSLSFSEEGNRVFISGTINGLKGTLSLARQITTSAKNPAYAVWRTEKDEAVITLELYESGWLFWHENYEKGANTRLLQQIREGILDGRLTDTTGVLALIEDASLSLLAGGKLAINGDTLAVSPLNGPDIVAVPSIWEFVWDEEAGSWSFQTEVREEKLLLQAGDTELLFERLGDSAALPEDALFRYSLELKPGDKGALVKLLQLRLTELGMFSGKLDSVYGDGTKKAVLAFETSRGLAEDGKADVGMLRLLYGD